MKYAIALVACLGLLWWLIPRGGIAEPAFNSGDMVSKPGMPDVWMIGMISLEKDKSGNWFTSYQVTSLRGKDRVIQIFKAEEFESMGYEKLDTQEGQRRLQSQGL